MLEFGTNELQPLQLWARRSQTVGQTCFSLRLKTNIAWWIVSCGDHKTFVIFPRTDFEWVMSHLPHTGPGFGVFWAGCSTWRIQPEWLVSDCVNEEYEFQWTARNSSCLTGLCGRMCDDEPTVWIIKALQKDLAYLYFHLDPFIVTNMISEYGEKIYLYNLS